MRILTNMLRQTCVYWAPGSTESGGRDYDDYGQPMFASPTELSCRWVDIAEEVIGAQGTVEKTRSKVYVGEDVRVGGVLMLGDLDSVTDEDDPKQNDGAWSIINFSKTPTLKATEFLRVCYL